MNSLNVAITGATGFIGQRVQLGLLAAGCSVRALVRRDSKHLHHLQAGCETFPVRLGDGEGMEQALAGVDAVVYCAGSVRGASLDDFVTANVDGVANVVKVLESGATHPPLLLFSSLAATRPELSHYAHSKSLGERAVQGYSGPWSILQPPAVYGPGDREMLPLLQAIRRGLAPITGPAGQRLSLLHVDDLCTAVLAWLAETEACQGQCFAIDDGRANGYDWPAIIHAVATGPVLKLRLPVQMLRLMASVNITMSRLFGYAPMLSPGKVRELRHERWLCDNEPFTRRTGWTPAISLAQGAEDLFRHPN